MTEESIMNQPVSWWRRIKALVWIIDAIQILGLWPLAVAIVSAIWATAAGYLEGIPAALLIPVFGGTFFIFLFGLMSLADRWRRWRAAKQWNPNISADEFLAVMQVQRDFLAWDAAWKYRSHLGSAVLAHMDIWKDAADDDLEGFRKATAAFLTVAFGKDTRTEFLREVAAAEPPHKRQVALSYLHGLVLRTGEEGKHN